MTTTPTSDAPETDPPAAPPEGDPTPDPTETVEHWKQLARKNEQRAKDNAQKAKDYDALKAATMSETERAVAEAKAQGRAEALRETSSKLVLAEVRAAASGRPVDVDALTEGIDATRFLTDDGEPDRDAITAWVDKVAPAQPGTPRPPDLGQGARGGQQNGADPRAAFARFVDGQLK